MIKYLIIRMPKVPKQHIKKAFGKNHQTLKLSDGAITAVTETTQRVISRFT